MIIDVLLAALLVLGVAWAFGMAFLFVAVRGEGSK